ncbi:MAG: hypothetical protein RR623_01640 [Bacilli bacterium]
MTVQERYRKIEELLNEYPIEKYPHSIGAYGIKRDGQPFVAMYYENENKRWVTTHSDYTHMEFDPVADVYGVLAQGATLFHVSDFVHKRCWQETLSQGNDCQYTQFYHGRRAYFEYCKNNGIDSEYMIKIDENFQGVETKFWKRDLRLQEKINHKISTKKYQKLDEVTLKTYEYYMAEQYYQEAIPMYTIENEYKDLIVYFAYEEGECVLQVFPNSKTKFTRDLKDWGFDFGSLLFETLESGGSIKYMSLDTHEGIMYNLDDIGIEELSPEAIEGLKKYLHYVYDNKIYQKLNPECKEYYRNLCSDINFDIQVNKKNHSRMER